MSSVGSSDSSSPSRAQEDTIRKNRESHQNAENDMVKKQAKEIRRLNEEHYTEIENLKQDHQAQMNDLRKATGTEINERDHKYNQDVADLRDLYKKQMTAQSEEAQRRDEALRKSTSGDLTQTKVQGDQRIKKLTSDFDKNLQGRENTFEDAIKQNKIAQKNAIADTRDKLERNYDEQSKSLKEERNIRVGGLQKGFDDYRQSAEANQRDSDLRHFQDQERSSKNLMRAVQKERLVKIDSDENLRDGFKEGLEQTRVRFEKAASKEREAGNISREEMRASVGDRIDNHINRLEAENLDLKEGNAREEVKVRQKMKREVANITDAYQKNMDNFQDQRDEAIRSSNDRVHKDVQKVRKELDNQATETNRYYRSHEEERNQIHHEAYDNLKSDMDIRNEQQKNNADNRVKYLYETTADEKARMAELQGENHKLTQFAHQDEMNTLRANLEADKHIAVNNLQEHIQKQELQHSEKMAQVVTKYEKQILAMKDELMKEKKVNEENLKRATEEMERQHKLSMDQVAMQNRDRLRQMDAHHNDELRSLNKRNDDRLDQVLAEVKRT